MIILPRKSSPCNVLHNCLLVNGIRGYEIGISMDGNGKQMGVFHCELIDILARNSVKINRNRCREENKDLLRHSLLAGFVR